MTTKTTKNSIATVLSSPLPIPYILATDMLCIRCNDRTKSYNQAKYLLKNHGICESCSLELSMDHVYGEYIDNMAREDVEAE